MAAELGLPPPAAQHQPPAPTTICDIGDDLLREIFLLLPSLPSLVRAALACSTFLHAVRSFPAFRRRFQALHPPQILGFFFESTAFPTFAPIRRRSDRDLAAVVRRSDFFLTHLPQDSGDSGSGWALESCHGGYVVLFNETTDQIAAYNPLTQVLDIFPMPHERTFRFFDFHIVISEEDQGVFRMVGIQHRSMSGQVPALIAVFSSVTREWKVLPWVEPYQPENGGATPMPPQPEDDGEYLISFCRRTRLNGLIYWKHTSQDYALVLDTVTLQFSRLDLPGFAGEIGQTKDGKLCIVGSLGTYSPEANVGMLAVWIWGADDDGVKEWKLAKPFRSTFVDVTAGYATVQVEAVIDGFVYVSVKYVEQPESLVSLCLETGKPCKLFDDTYTSPAHPYIMTWPRSLVCNKDHEDSQAKVTGDSVADVCLMGTKESPDVLDV